MRTAWSQPRPPLARIGTRGRIFTFKQGLEDVKWGSIPGTVFGLALLTIIIFLLPRAATFRDKVLMIAVPIAYLFISNAGFFKAWRHPRVVILTEESMVAKRTIGSDIVLPWAVISTVKVPWFHLDIPGVTVISRPLHCRFIIGEEIEDFEELVRLIQHYVRLHNPSAQFIGLPPSASGWKPSAAQPASRPVAPAWLRFEVPSRPRSLRGPLVTGLGTVGFAIGLRGFLMPDMPPAQAMRMALLAMIVLVLGVLLWLVDRAKSPPT